MAIVTGVVTVIVLAACGDDSRSVSSIASPDVGSTSTSATDPPRQPTTVPSPTCVVNRSNANEDALTTALAQLIDESGSLSYTPIRQLTFQGLSGSDVSHIAIDLGTLDYPDLSDEPLSFDALAVEFAVPIRGRRDTSSDPHDTWLVYAPMPGPNSEQLLSGWFALPSGALDSLATKFAQRLASAC